MARLIRLLLLCAAFASHSSISVAQTAGVAGYRVAYLSTLDEADAAKRIDAIRKQVEQQWPRTGRPDQREVQYRTFRYELPNTAKAESELLERERIARNNETEGRNQRTLDDLMAWNPTLIFAPGALPARAAGQRTTTIPIVFACKCNPLMDGWQLVRDPASPEANLTGFTRYHFDMLGPVGEELTNLNVKRMEILRRTAPSKLDVIALVYGDEYRTQWNYESAAARLGLRLEKIKLTESSIDQLPALLAERKVRAAIVLQDTFLDKFTRRLVQSSQKVPFPVLFPWDEADVGAWMHYGTVTNIPEKSAEYIVNLLKGRKIKDYPVEFPKQMELAVNLTTARQHGWQFPRDFLLMVDRTID